MTADQIARYVGFAVMAILIFVAGQVFGLLLGMEVIGRHSRSPVLRWMAAITRFLIGPDVRELLDAKSEVVEPETIPPEPSPEDIEVPSFGRPELLIYRQEEYEEWLRCCGGGELLTPGSQFYLIPITNSDERFLSLCLEHRQIPTIQKGQSV